MSKFLGKAVGATILITDTNIFLDLIEGDILAQLFELPHQIHTTDIILSNELAPAQQALLDDFVAVGKLEVRSFTVTELMRIGEWVEAARLEAGEMSVLFHAQQVGGILLSGDAAFRRYAREQGMAVHGTLWVLDELVAHAVLSPRAAHQALSQMLAQGSDRRLPKAPCEARLKRWKAS